MGGGIMTRKLTILIAVTILCVATLAGSVFASSLGYNTQRRQIKAGVLQIDNSDPTVTMAPAWVTPMFPLLFYVMDNRLDLKPKGWEFVNPLAPSGSTKSMPWYWFVNSTAPLSDLTQLDVLYLGVPPNTTIQLSRHPEFIQNLRKFVDGGGILWIDNARFDPTTTGGELDNLFVADQIAFNAAPTGDVNMVDVAHPVACRPFPLTWQDARSLGMNGTASLCQGLDAGIARFTFAPIIRAGSKTIPLIAGAQYGSGYIVVSGASIGAGISQPVLQFGTLQAAHAQDLRFAFNVINWESEFSGFRKNARHTGQSFTPVGAPLITLWEYRAGQQSAQSKTCPVIVDDIVLYADGNNMLHAFDLWPQRVRQAWTTDWTWNASADDGIQDLSLGAQYDEIWNNQLSGPAATPLGGYLGINGDAIAAAAVLTQDGKFSAFDLRSSNPSPLSLPNVTAFGSDDIPSPVFGGGTLFMVDGQGSMNGLDVVSMTKWGSNPLGKAASGTPAVGYVRDPATGSLEMVAYQPTKGVLASGTKGDITPYTLEVYGEVVTTDFHNHGAGPVNLPPLRTMGNAILGPPFLKVRYAALNGVTGTVAGVTLAPPATVQVPLGAIPDGSTVRVDYRVTPAGTPPVMQNRAPFDIRAGANDPPGQGVECTPALGPDDTLYFSTSNGNFYAVQESGIGPGPRWKVKWRWFLGDPTPKGLFGDAKPVGSPVLANGKVIFTVNSGSNAYVLAFQADPTFALSVGTPIDQRNGVTVTQADWMNPGTNTGVSVIQNSDQSALDVNYDTGRITIRNFRQGGELSASADMDVVYTPVNGVPGPSSTHGAFKPTASPREKINNLDWAIQLPANVTSSPVVMGNMLFVGMANGTLAAMDIEKLSQAPRTGPEQIMVNDSVKSGANQCFWNAPVMDGAANPNYVTVTGAHGMLAVTSAEGLSVLYSPTTLVADGNRIMEVDAGGNVTWSCDSTVDYAESVKDLAGTPGPVIGAANIPFNRPSVARKGEIGGYLVCDTGNNRIVLVDSSGRVLWGVTKFTDPNHMLPAGASLTLSTPTDVTMFTDTTGASPVYHYLIADSGNYRIVDIAVVYNQALGIYENQLAWVTKSGAAGRAYRYTSAKTLYDVTNGNSRFVMAVVSNKSANATGVESKGSALVKIDYDGAKRGEIIGGPYKQFPIDAPQGTTVIDLVYPTFMTRMYTGQNAYSDVVVDSRGIHICRYDVNTQSNNHFGPVYDYTQQDYQSDGGSLLAPVYAQILANGNIVVTNQAVAGVGSPSPKFGEVFELKFDTNLNKYKIISRFSSGTNSYGLRQPSCAERVTN